MKKIGLIGAIAIGLGAIIGAGIFVLSGTAISLAGEGAIIAFLITGIIAIMYAFEISELTSELPKEHGATYSFAYKAFGSEPGFITGLLIYVGYSAGVAAIATGFGSYLASMLGASWQPYSILFSVLLIVALTFINARGLKKAAQTDIVLVAVKLIALLFFIGFAIYIGKWTTGALFGLGAKGIGGILSASVVVLFAYSGFQAIASITPEIEGGGKTAAKAILISAAASMVLYVLVTASLMAMVPASKFGLTANPLTFALTYSGAPQWLFIVIGIGALVATASASLSMLIGASRFMYQMSLDGMLPGPFKAVEPSQKTPTNALYATAALSMLFLFAGNIYVIATISNFGTVFGYLIASFALIKFRQLRSSENLAARIRRRIGLSTTGIVNVPFYPLLPAAAIVASVLFMYIFPRAVVINGFIFILLSVIAYYFLKGVKKRPEGDDKLFS